MSEFQSLDELIAAGQGHTVKSNPSQAGDARSPSSTSPRSLTRAPHRTTKTVKKTIRLTAFPENSSLVNQNESERAKSDESFSADSESQVTIGTLVTTQGAGECEASPHASSASAGGQEPQNPVNHAQVVVPAEFPDEIRQRLAQIGVNLRESQLGRKHVFDEFLRGRLVSLLAMGLTLRQSAAALGLSHNAIWKELRKNVELSEQVNAARFQAQIEPLLVILRESRQNWRAATWLINYLNRALSKPEESCDERTRYDKEAAREHLRERAEHYAARQIENIKAGRRVREELERS